ncbi:MAG: efflux RND transporter periplasmic adaptor subunit [Actinomycetota bacterium]|nr:efflux RND transporter periplasmic adaptor subunit [Actinomycetota bacterium]
MKNKKVLIIGLVLIFAILFIARSCGRSPSPRYTFTPVLRESIVELVSAGGNAIPTSAVEVFSSITGKVNKIYVTNGDVVDTGDDLFRTYNSVTGQEDIVTSPAHGTVTNLAIINGTHVDPAATGTAAVSAMPALLITDMSSYTIRPQINEVDIDKIKTGLKATISFDAIRDKTFAGTIANVDTVGTNTQGVITYNTYITVTDPPNELRPMMTAGVDIETTKHDNVLTVPNIALKPYRGGKAVQVLDKKTNKPRYVPVKVGIVGSLRTEITEGVQEGQKVITGTLSSQSRGFLQFRGGGN